MRKVAVYARVSTEHEAQLSALENQIQYYDEELAKSLRGVIPLSLKVCVHFYL